MKSFTKFISEAKSNCNKTKEGKYCPKHKNEMCPSLLKDYSTASTNYENFPEQYENEKVTIEDAKGNTFLEIIDLIRPKSLVKESRKSGDYSLHDWFAKSKSSNGKPGWVQLGGKWAGEPCARQEGQTSTPKCGSSKMAANLSPEEEETARRRKNREDPNQPQKSGAAKPTNVRTEEMNYEEFKQMPGNLMNTQVNKLSQSRSNLRKGRQTDKKRNREIKYDMQIKRIQMAGKQDYNNKGDSYGKFYQNPLETGKIKNHRFREEFMQILESQKDKPSKDSSKKDACYSKVKSRYSVWPSAYASGALVKCRKVGAANWGNKTKKEEFNLEERYLRIQTRGTTYSILLNWRGKYITTQMFFQQFTRPTKEEVTREVRKVYPNAIILSFNPSEKDPTKPLLFTGEPNGSQKY